MVLYYFRKIYIQANSYHEIIIKIEDVFAGYLQKKKKEILASRHGVTSACVKKRNKLPSRVKKKTSPVSSALLRLRRSPSRVQSRGAVVLLHPGEHPRPLSHSSYSPPTFVSSFLVLTLGLSSGSGRSFSVNLRASNLNTSNSLFFPQKSLGVQMNRMPMSQVGSAPALCIGLGSRASLWKGKM